MKNIIIFCFAIVANFSFANQLEMEVGHFEKNETSLFTPPCHSLVTLPASTLVFLEINETIESESATIGQLVQFRVVTDVRVDNRVVIATGAMAVGRVKNIGESTYNHPETMTIEVTSVQSVDGQMVALNGTEQTLKGKYTGQGMTIYIGTKATAHVMNEMDIKVN